MYANEQEALRALAADTAPFGTELATAVAAKLRSGASLGFGHRDYCGMGMDFSEDHYRYGEIWDSYLEPQRSWHGQQDFIGWLAVQSTASLARLDDKDFFKGNQVITRSRLEAFLTEQSFF